MKNSTFSIQKKGLIPIYRNYQKIKTIFLSGFIIISIFYLISTPVISAPLDNEKPIVALEPYLSDSGNYSSKNDSNHVLVLENIEEHLSKIPFNWPIIIAYLLSIFGGGLLGFSFGKSKQKQKNAIEPEKINFPSAFEKKQKNQEQFFHHALCQIRLMLDDSANEFHSLLELDNHFQAQNSFFHHKIAKYLNQEHKSILQAINRFCTLSEGIVLHPIKIDAILLLEKGLEKFEASFGTSVLEIQRIFSNQTLLLEVDHSRMLEVISILLENSFRYCQIEKGQIFVTLKETKDQQCLIQIKDNGLGIASEIADNLLEFDYFRSIKNNHRGIGLGLYYASEIVKAHHGSIRFKSGIEKGFCTTILLPLKNHSKE